MAGDQDSHLDEENQDDLDGKSEAVDKSSKSLEKKPKTPEQIERERMRRRRRRQRQRIMRSLETKPEAEKNVAQKPAGTEVSADQKKQVEVKKRNEEKLQAEKAKKDMEDRKVGDAVKGEEKVVDLKKVDELKPGDEIPPRGQQLRDETHPRVLDANVAPDMRFDKPVQGDQDQGLQEADKAKDDQQKAEQERLKKIKEEEKRAADLKRKEKIEKEKAEKIRKEKEEQELKMKEDELKKTELEEQNKKAEEEKVLKEQEETARLEKAKLEEKNKQIEKEKARLEEEEKLDVAAEKAEAAEVEEPVPVYHPEPEYTTNSFAFEEPKVEKPLDDETESEPETELEVKSDEKKVSATDLELMSELMDKDSEPVVSQPEAGEELIDVSEPVVEESAEDTIETAEAKPDEHGKTEEEVPGEDTFAEELPQKEEPLDEEEDTLVSADSVVDEIPIFPPKEVEVAPVDSDDELTFGDSNDQNDVPLIPVGKMREDHAGSSPDLTLPYDGGPVVEREVTPTEGPNLLNENVEPESKEATEDSENVEKKKEEMNVAEELNEKKAPAVDFAMKLAKASSDVLKKFVPAVGGFLGNLLKFLKGIFGKLNIRMVGGVVAVLVVIGLGYFGFTQKWHEQAWNAVSGTFGSFFKPKVDEPKIEVKPDVKDQRAFGITTALIFAQNKGAVSDRLTPDISVALYYGGLQEPRVQGETGISAATFYGELKDQADFVNVYVEYVDTLEHMQSLYKTDVYKLLDQTTKRDVALLKHIDELKAMKDKGLRIQEQIGINLDDLKVSFESLNGEKNKGETDFFAALSDLQGQKSDTLLKQFIEVSQKQVALKARIAALTKLQAYYVTALMRLDKRLEAIDKNRDPLIQGIRVVDVPGSDLDLIIRGQ